MSLLVLTINKFPLCAILKPPMCKSAKKGCIFLREVSPVVEYLLCPIAKLPGSFFSVSGSVNDHQLNPVFFGMVIFAIKETMPQPS